MEHIGIFGGTFDPIHIGHLICAQFVYEQRNLDKIIFIPAFISPFKSGKNTFMGKDRIPILKAAIDPIPYFDYDDYELTKGGISYSYDTITYFSKKYKNIDLIIGFDNLVSFDKWKNPDDIISLANLTVMRRKIDKQDVVKNKYFDKATIIDTPYIEISSTMIRERIQKRLPIDYLVPEAVKKYIDKNIDKLINK